MQNSGKHTFVGNLALASLKSLDNTDRPFYQQAINHACSSSPPPYGMQWFGNEFRRLGRNPKWLVNLIISDVDMEGYSAWRLWEYADSLSDKKLADQMREHALDEERHSRMFAKILFNVFPSLKSQALLQQLKAYAPGLRNNFKINENYTLPEPSSDETLNSMILINLYEVKALILGKLLLPVVLAHAPETHRARLANALNTIIQDEAHHIRYSADFIEDACQNGDKEFVFTTIEEFQHTLNIITESELTADNADGLDIACV